MDHAFTSPDLHSKAEDPTYAGVLSFMRRQYTKNLTGADAVVWGIPFDSAVSNRPGARFGPQGIRRASAGMDNDPQYPFSSRLFDDMAVIDYGDCTFDYGIPTETPQSIEAQATHILNGKNSPYLHSLGGDHFVTYPLLKAHVAKHGPLSLIQFDAHQDTWSDNGNRIDHGTFISRAVNEGLILAESSIQIGIRTIAPQTCGIEILDALQLHEMTIAQIIERITNRITKSGGNTKTYLTFDIDCLDPAFAPGTGTPVSGGLSTAQTLLIMRGLSNLEIVGSDLVEVAPAYDHSDITSMAGATLSMYMLGLLWERRFKK